MHDFLSAGWLVAYFFAALWLCGWTASVRETSVSQETNPLKKLGGIVLLFFIWPYIVLCMAGQGDI